MLLIIVVVLLILLLGGGSLGYRQWGAPGGLGVVGLVLLIVLLMVLAGVIPLHGQEPTPTLSLDTSAVAAAPAVINLNGAPAAVVPAPSGASKAEVEAVAEQSAENLEAVADNKVTIEQATRDPTKTADPGASMVFPALLALAAGLSKWAIGVAVRKAPSLPNSAIGLISNGVLAGVVITGFYLLHTTYPDLPQTLFTWLAAAGLGSMLGSATQSGIDWRTDSRLVPGPGAVRP